MGLTITIVFAILLGLFIIAAVNSKKNIASHWQHFYEGIKFSSTDFYSRVETVLQEREVIGLQTSRVFFLTKSIFSDKREYLQIAEREYYFYICAAPFGTGTFVSWWLCVEEEGLLERIPIINKLLGKDRTNKTFYQMDTEAMYKSSIHSAVLHASEEYTSIKGLRLSDIESQYTDVR